jgi:hypothetical protein
MSFFIDWLIDVLFIDDISTTGVESRIKLGNNKCQGVCELEVPIDRLNILSWL